MDMDSTATLAPVLPAERTETIVCTADVAECTCPEFCERDHEND